MFFAWILRAVRCAPLQSLLILQTTPQSAGRGRGRGRGRGKKPVEEDDDVDEEEDEEMMMMEKSKPGKRKTPQKVSIQPHFTSLMNFTYINQ